MVDAVSAVRRGRVAAAALFTDACVIERESGSVMDPVTFEERPSWVPVYAGACRVKVLSSAPVEGAGRTYVVTDALLQLPVGDVRFLDNDRVTVTAAAYDDDLEGVVLTVTSREVRTHATMRRLHVSEVTG